MGASNSTVKDFGRMDVDPHPPFIVIPPDDAPPPYESLPPSGRVQHQTTPDLRRSRSAGDNRGTASVTPSLNVPVSDTASSIRRSSSASRNPYDHHHPRHNQGMLLQSLLDVERERQRMHFRLGDQLSTPIYFHDSPFHDFITDPRSNGRVDRGTITPPRRTPSNVSSSPSAMSNINTSVVANTHASPAENRTPRRSTTNERILEILRDYNTIFLVDDSSSMSFGTRWKDTGNALAGLADIASQFGVDGIDLHFINSPKSGYNMRTAKEINQLFQSVTPRGITMTGRRIETLSREYLGQIEEAQRRDRANGDIKETELKKIKPVNYIILTDGEPTDDPESVIVEIARRLDRGGFPLAQLGMQFVQVGDDPKAAEALEDLDDALSKRHKIRDIVDTTPFKSSRGQLGTREITKILLGGINRRLDKKGSAVRPEEPLPQSFPFP